MAELSTFARPYAKAAFDYANSVSAVVDWEDFLFVASSIVSDEAFKPLLGNPAISAEAKTQALIDIYNEQVSTQGETPFKALLFSAQGRKPGSLIDALPKASIEIKNFILQLAEQERLSLLPQVYEQYHLQRVKTLKQVNAYLTTAYALTEAQRELLQTRLELSLNASVILHENVDKSLLAGATIKIGDKVVDDSARGKLKQLRTQLTA